MLGRPLEYFNGPARRALDDPAYPDDRVAQIEWILTKTRTSNGVCGVKLFSGDHPLVASSSNGAVILPVDVYVYLERHDRLGQAISWVRAMQTQQYRSTQPICGSIAYDGIAIRDRLEALDRECALWSDFFRRHRLEPLRLSYEQALLNPQSAIDRIAAALRIRERAVIDPAGVNLAIQRDAITEEWRTRYLREFTPPESLTLETQPNAS
jgi:LPS sulfotransferase NodH